MSPRSFRVQRLAAGCSPDGAEFSAASSDSRILRRRLRNANAHAVFITTSGFTDAAIDVARQVGVELIDGPLLVSIAGKANQALAALAARQAGRAEG